MNTTVERQQQLSQKKGNAAQQREAAIQAIQAEIGLELALTQDAILRIGNIKADKEKIAQDKAKITELKHEITEDAILLSAACAAAAISLGFNFAADAAIGYYSYEINKLRNELVVLKMT